MIFVPLLHYFQCKNNYSGNEDGMRYRLTPGKRTVSGLDGTEKEESILTADVWPDPWTLEYTDPALRMQAVFPLSTEGLNEAAQWLRESYNAAPEKWKNCPSMLDSDPWVPLPAEDAPHT
ncbi:MAG: hypothetical protein ACI4JC_00595 [Faecalibacterium sp.]